MSTAEQPKYSRAEISDESKRKKTAEEIKATNSWVDKKKTPEGKKELSQTWVQKANLTPAQKEALCDELLVKDIDSEDPKELERRVIALQKHLGFPAKDCDGILWWKTLEKTDKMIEEQHKTGDEETGEKDESGAYGFDRVAHQEAKKIEEEKTFQKDMNQLAAELKDWNGIEDDRLPKGVGVDQDKQVLVKTDDKTQFWDASKNGGSWNSRAESLNNEQNIATIKDVLGKLDTFEEGQEYVKSLGTSTAYTEKEMNEFNAILKGKGWELKMDDQGEFQEYTLVDIKKKTETLKDEQNLASIKDVLSKMDTFEEGQEYAKSLQTSTPYTTEQMNDFNSVLKGKGWALKMDNQGEYQDYVFVDLKSEQEESRLAEL